MFELAAILIIIVIFARAAFNRVSSRSPVLNDFSSTNKPYKLRQSILTATELAFYHALCEALPHYAICPQVRMADIVTPTTRSYRDLNRVANKHVDFVICDRSTLRPIVAIELDDRSHARTDRQERDTFVNNVYLSVGLPIIRVKPQPKYDTLDLRQYIERYAEQTTFNEEPRRRARLF